MADAAAKLPFVPKRKKLLTRPVLKFEIDKPRYVKIEGAMFIGKDLEKNKPADASKPKKEPATIANVINLETGEQCQILVNAVIRGVFHDEYPEDSYVGKCFMITKQSRQPGKSYDPFYVEEIEDPLAKPEDAKAEEKKADDKVDSTPAANKSKATR